MPFHHHLYLTLSDGCELFGQDILLDSIVQWLVEAIIKALSQSMLIL